MTGATAWISRAAVLHHVFGIGGQVAAAAPIIVVTIILSHTTGLVTAGQFVILAGASAILFTVANLGLVYYVVIDRLQEFDARDFALTRLGATVLAIVALFGIGNLLGSPLELILLVALLRVADAAVEMTWGLDLLREPSDAAMKRYALLNTAKLVLVVVPATASFAPGAVGVLPLLIAGAILGATVCWVALFRLAWGERAQPAMRSQSSRSLRLARRAVWFTVGASVSAAASSAPRLLIERFYIGDTMGIVGVTLAFSTLFAMAFMSSWLRWFPRLSASPEERRGFGGVVLESLAMAILFLLLNASVMPLVVAIVFGFDADADNQICRQVLLASTLFAFAMNMANLFKVTAAVWLESAAYVVGLGGGLAFVLLAPSAGVPGFLLAAGVAMLLIVAGGIAWLRSSADQQASVGARKHDRAAFLRLASRPIPRVLRMMQAARDAGLDAFFVGAFRAPRLAGEDCWEGFAVYRVGKSFPLLNGRRPWFYLRSVLRCNRGFLAVLRRKRPRIVHASDFEAMPAAICYRLTYGGRLVYNIHDNLAQRYGVPRPLAWCLNALEGTAVLVADQTIVPEEFRRSGLPRWCRHRIVVIRNLPPDNGPTPPPAFENGKIRLFYGGWLDWQRGLAGLLALAREADIELRVAGEGAAEIIAELEGISSVTYLGFIDSTAILEETRRCHFVPVLYDPARTINRFAASNKLAEALSIGRPVILNSELEIAKELTSSACLIDVKYAEVATVASRLRAVASDATAYAAACANARRTYEARYSWEKTKIAALGALTGWEQGVDEARRPALAGDAKARAAQPTSLVT